MKCRLSPLKYPALAAVSLLCTVGAIAQAVPSGTPPPPTSKVDIYGGYGYFRPFNSQINNVAYTEIYNPNATASMAAYFTRHLGVQIEGSYFSGAAPRGSIGQCYNGACSDRDAIRYTAQAGLIYRAQVGRFVPFVHVLGGGVRANGPFTQPLTWGQGATGGVGVDIILPFFHDMFAIRPIQADVQYSHINYGMPSSYAYFNSRGVGDVTAVKLSGGLVLRMGNMVPPPAVMEDCNVQPASIYPGDPISISASPSNLNPKRKANYTWSSTGGQVTPSDASATIATAGLAPGSYTVTGHVSQGAKPYQQASCTSNFTVKEFEPPTLSCSADPSTVMPGTAVTITSSGSSPQNRSLTYSYTTTAGQLSGSGATVSLSTANVPSGSITIGCSVVDDLGKSASASATVTVSAPPAPPAPAASNLCSVSFERDRRRPVRVDNEAKGCLDDIALTLGHDSTSKLVIVGKHAPEEKPDFAAERVLNVRSYLTQEKGIDPSRIEVREGAASDRTVDNILVPSGATFPDTGTTTFDPAAIRSHGQPYGKPGAPAGRRKRR